MDQFKLAPVNEADPDSFRVPGLGSELTARVKCLLSTAAERCATLGRDPTLSEAMLQLRIRVLVTGGPAAEGQILAMRRFLAALLEARDAARDAGIWLSAGEAFPAGIEVPEWLDPGWTEVEEAAAQLERQTPAVIRRLAAGEMSRMIDDLIRFGDFGTEAEIASRLAGRENAGAGADSRRPPQRRWEHIDEKMLTRLLDRLPPAGSGSPLRAVLADDLRHPSLSRLLAVVTWLTGMRFIEVFDFRLMGPRPGTDPASALDDPLRAGRGGRLESRLAAAAADSAGRNRDAAVMIINTAKTKNASPGIDNSQRALILRGIAPPQLARLSVAASLRLFDLNRTQLKRIRKGCSHCLSTASKAAFPDRADPVTLHTLRHAFADSARAGMGPAAAAALTGHSAPCTLGGYGRRRPAGFSGSRPDRWLPQPDPARAEELRAVWEAGKKPASFPGRSPESDLPEPVPD